ncbi:MAG: hypothetical protein IJ735_02310 [Clostridia bacterium]|nr:hypothetical protein [Clostridia bacterium]
MNDKILTILASMTGENENLVVGKGEIIDLTDGALDARELDKRIQALEVNDMLVVRYSDAESYCVALRPKGRVRADKLKEAEIAAAAAAEEAGNKVELRTPVPTEEDETEKTPIVTTGVSFKKLALVCAGSSFLGGLLAAIVAFLFGRLGA